MVSEYPVSLVQLLAHTFKRLLKKDIDEINQGFIFDPVKTLPVLAVRVILTSKVPSSISSTKVLRKHG